jgi:hypothetical protein
VARYKGKPQLRFAPFYGHNTGRRAVGCAECHGNPAFLGFGQHVIEKGAVRGTLLCEKNPKQAARRLRGDGGRARRARTPRSPAPGRAPRSTTRCAGCSP